MPVIEVTGVKLAFHVTDTDILARIVARMSASVLWNAGFNADRLCASSPAPASQNEAETQKFQNFSSCFSLILHCLQ